MTPDRATLSVKILNSAPSAVDVAVSANDTVVLAAAVPAALDGCSYEPVFEHHFDLAPGQTDITVEAGADQVTIPAVVAGEPQWLFVGLQRGFPPTVQLSAEEPQIPS